MDWLEEFFPFLREIDGGSGALEVAIVVLVIGVMAVIGMTAVRRTRPAHGGADRDPIDDAAPDDRRAPR